MKQKLKCKLCKKQLLLAEDQYTGTHSTCRIKQKLDKEENEELFNF